MKEKSMAKIINEKIFKIKTKKNSKTIYAFENFILKSGNLEIKEQDTIIEKIQYHFLQDTVFNIYYELSIEEIIEIMTLICVFYNSEKVDDFINLRKKLNLIKDTAISQLI
jgi:hypothetical protein